MNKWFSYKNKADVTEIYINGDIESDVYNNGFLEEILDCKDTNIYPLEVKKALDEASGNEIHVHINSAGGDLFAGVAISNMLKNHKSKTIAYIDGLAASSASIIAFGCDEIVMPDNAYLMIHRPMTGVYGNADDFLKTIDTLEKLEEGLVNTYRTKAIDGIEDITIKELIVAESWFSGITAKEFFKITSSDSKNVLNYAKTSQKFKVLPQEISDHILAMEKEKNEQERIENMKKEIEITLALGGI